MVKDILITAGVDLAGFTKDLKTMGAQLRELNQDAFQQDDKASLSSYGKLKNAISDVSEAISRIPVVGQIWDVLTMPVTAALAAKKEILDINKLLQKEAEGADQLRQKWDELHATQRQVREWVAVNGDTQKEYLKQISDELDKVADSYVKMANDQVNAGKVTDGMEQKRIGLMGQELNMAAEIAAIKERAKNQFGETTPQAIKMAAAGIALAEMKNRLSIRAMQISIDQEIAERDKNEQLSKLGITIDDQLDAQHAIQSSLLKQMQTLRDMGMINSKAYSELRLSLKESQKAYDQIQHNRQMSEQAASDSVANKNAEMAGNKRNAELLKNTLDIQRQITEAQRAGNHEVVKKLREQKALNDLEIKAQAILKKPAERREERKHQREHDRAIRTAAARDRARAQSEALPGFGGRRSNEGHVSAATARARAGFVAANVAKDAKAAQPPVAMMQVASLVVGELKSK